MNDTEKLINALVEAKPVFAGFAGSANVSDKNGPRDKFKELIADIDSLDKNRAVEAETFQEKVTRVASMLLCDLSEESKRLPSIKNVVVALGKCNKLIPPSKNKYEW